MPKGCPPHFVDGRSIPCFSTLKFDRFVCFVWPALYGVEINLVRGVLISIHALLCSLQIAFLVDPNLSYSNSGTFDAKFLV